MTEKRLSFPAPGHIGVVVKNVEKVAQSYSTSFGIGPFEIYDFEPLKTWVYGLEAEPFKLKIGLADMGAVKLELLQVVSGNPLHRKFLETHGEGLQHIGFYVENYDEWKAYVQGERIPIIYEAEIEDAVRGRRRAFYMDSRAPGGVLFEIIEKVKMP
jgi:methylmalonyl-CoA/ethylmalonyl-CoA epimerase